ncbi:MAG: serine/threonine-protein kinase [Kiritimatiellia bacterium]
MDKKDMPPNLLSPPPPGSRDKTVLEETTPPPPPDADRMRLIETYRAILREGALRYPVAYHFIQELGKGRQGVVYLAVRQGARGCHTRHAVKLFDPSIYSTAERYWTDMGRIAGQVSRLQPTQHVNLIACDIYDESNGVGFIQMNAVDGIDLQYFLSSTHLAIARGQCSDDEWRHFMSVLFRLQGDRILLTPGIAVHILREILAGLQHLHEAGFLHGDIKPSNIMVDRTGGIRSVDFGRASLIGERISIQLGSPLYMAPEIHRLEPGLPQSDMYSLGLLAVELLGGRVPFNPAIFTDDDLLAAKMKLPDKLETWLPPYVVENELLMAILKKMLQPDPKQRFRSARECSGSSRGLRGVQRQLAKMDIDAEYDMEIERYVEKLLDPTTGHINPRMD